MAFERPGVYVRETPAQTQVSAQNSNTVAAFLGTALRGPTKPTLISSWSAYTSNFGPLSNDYDLGYAVYQYFANGGRDAYVTRIAKSDATPATSAPQGTPSGGSALALFTLSARSVGTWANYSSGAGLRAVITFDPSTLVSSTSSTVVINSSSVFSLSLLLNGVEVERWQELSLDPTSGRYIKDVLELFSNYVTSSTALTITSGSTVTVTVSSNTTLLNADFASGSEGTVAISETDWDKAIKLHDTITSPLLINFVGQTTTTVVDKALDYAASRADSFVIIDCGLTANAGNLVTGYSANNKGYGALYFPALKMADPARTGPAAVRTCYPGGAVAGAYVRSEATRGVAKAPAGYSLDLRNVYGLSVTPTEAEQATLYNTKNVNVFRALPGGTFVINGARTLATTSPNKFIPVRRTLNFLNSSLKQQTGFAVFEPNDERLWNKINNGLNQFLTNFWATGNLKGNSASEAFYIICDSTNNTPASIADGIVNIEVGVSLLSPAEFVVINISQWAGNNA